MNNNNFLWETILSDIKKEIPEKVFETWFLHSYIDSVDFIKKEIFILSNNSLISEYLKNVFDLKIKSSLKNNTAIDFNIFYNYIDDNNIIINKDYKNNLKVKEDKLVFNDKFLAKNKPSGIQNFTKQPSFVFNDDEYKEPVSNTILKSKNNPSLKKHFTFDNFVSGEGNKYAFSIAQSVAEYPGVHNPVFIYGGVGLGKTHLLHAIGNELEKNNPDFKIECISSEKFLNDFMQAIRPGKESKHKNLDEEFRNKYRSVDALLIDDIQFLSDKTETQNAFFHTFNELQLNDKQIVLVSDRRPSQLDGLEDRLVSRFDSGLVADITPPDYETRIAIIKFKCEQSNIPIDNSIISYISVNITGNIRELEGILQEIKLQTEIYKSPVSLQSVENILKRRNKTIKKKIVPNDIINVVSKFYNINADDMLSAKRNKEVVFARMVAIYLCREITDLSLPAIGKLFNKDHSSIFYSNSKIASIVAENENNILENLENIKDNLNKL